MTARWTAAALIAMVAVAAFGFGVRAGDMRDFEVYWTAAERAAQGEPLYRTSDGHYQFKYLPAFAMLTIPIAWLPLEAAKTAWFVVSAGLIVALLSLSIAALPERRRPASLLIAVAIVAMGKFYGHELVLGQVNLLFGVIVAGGLAAFVRQRVSLGVALITASIAVKPYSVLFVPWMLYVHRRRAVAPIGASVAGILLVPVAIYGIVGTRDLHLAWWTTVTGSTPANLTNQDNVSLAALFAKWMGIGTPAATLAAIAGIVLLAAAALIVVRGAGLKHRESLEGALLLALIPLLSPQGWDYVFLVATPAVVLFANYDDRAGQAVRIAAWVALAVIGLAIFDILGRARYAQFMEWSLLTPCFLVLLGALAALRLQRAA